MIPPQLHISLQALLTAGIGPISTVGDPGIQGAVVIGTQGIGVSTPIAADVAADTVGLVIEVHIPNGMILTNGLLSIMFATGIADKVRFTGGTIIILGAVPKLHCNIAPPVTNMLMAPPFF